MSILYTPTANIEKTQTIIIAMTFKRERDALGRKISLARSTIELPNVQNNTKNRILNLHIAKDFGSEL
jgi:hypothetical protein